MDSKVAAQAVRDAASAARAMRWDSLASVFESMTGSMEPGALAVRKTPMLTLGPSDIDGMLLHDWRARREVYQMGGDLTRAGVDVEDLPEWVDPVALASAIEGDDTDGDASDGLLASCGALWLEGEANGGAVLIAITDDGHESHEPLELGSLRVVHGFEVLDRWQVMPFRRTGMAGPVDYWMLTGITGTVLRVSQIVHPSRVLVHAGMPVGRRWQIANQGWGASRLELLRDQRETVALGLAHLGRLLGRTSQDVVTLAELSELIESKGEAAVLARMQTIARGLNSLGMAVLDGGVQAEEGGGGFPRNPDTFQTMARPMGGARDIVEMQHDDWRRGTGMPKVVADGEVAGGLNSGEEAGPWRAWGGAVAAEQRRTLVPWLSWCLGLLFASREGPTGGRVPETWTIKPRPLAKDDEQVAAEIAKTQAETDSLSLMGGVLKASEVRTARHVEGVTGPIRVPESAVLPEASPEDIAAEMLAAQGGAGAPAGEDVQGQALNGAQIKALVDLLAAVTGKLLPAEVATWLVGLAVPGLDTKGVEMAMRLAAAWELPEVMPAVAAPAASVKPAGLDAVDTFAREFAIAVRTTTRLDDATAIGAVGFHLRRDGLPRIAERDDEYPDLGVFVRVPDRLAAQFPYKPKDTSPPHCTVLFVGPSTWEELPKARAVVGKLMPSVLPCTATLGELGYFETETGRVAWVAVEFDPPLDNFHEQLKAGMSAEGLIVKQREGAWVAHATLAYLAAGEEYTGPVPVGSWQITEFEVWHGEHG